jgi:hypothetical protein
MIGRDHEQDSRVLLHCEFGAHRRLPRRPAGGDDYTYGAVRVARGVTS